MNTELVISPDQIIFFQFGFVKLNGTIVYTWVVMAILVIGSLLVTRKLRTGTKIPRWQNLLETIVSYMRGQVREMTKQSPEIYLPYVGTLFLFISISNLLSVVPLYHSPAGSLSTAAALAVSVFIMVPVYGIYRRGILGYLKLYIKPSILMMPFNILGELSRTLALAVRLFGNVMSGTMIIGVLLSIAPLFLPVIMQALELIIGQIQAYIFAALATIYIASATRIQEDTEKKKNENTT